MRRAEREITDFKILQEIIRENNSAVISMVDGEIPYGVMMNYAPVFENDKVKFIFHGAKEGRKIDCLRKNPSVSLFINDIKRMEIISGGAISSKWTTYYRSIIATGKIRFIEDLREKMFIAECFMRHYTDGEILLPESALNATIFFELIPEQISGKENSKKRP